MGCRNVTKIFVPKEYDFIPLLSAFKNMIISKTIINTKTITIIILALHI
jgi:hypothetical protein